MKRGSEGIEGKGRWWMLQRRGLWVHLGFGNCGSLLGGVWRSPLAGVVSLRRGFEGLGEGPGLEPWGRRAIGDAGKEGLAGAMKVVPAGTVKRTKLTPA